MSLRSDTRRAFCAATLLAVAPLAAQALTLDQALSFALDHNYNIRTAEQVVEEQYGVLVTARAGRLPRLELSGQGAYNDENIDTSIPQNDNSWAIALEVTETLYAGGRVGANIAASRAAREAALADLRATMADELLRVRVGFLDALLAREQINVQQENVRLLEERLQQVRHRFEAGTVSNFDLLRAEVALANARPDLIEARSAFDIALANLKLAMGTGPNEPLPQVEGDLVAGEFNVDEAAAQREAQQQRPELSALERRIEAAGERISGARGGYLPSVEAFASYNVAEHPTGADDYVDGWRAGLRGSWAIWDSGQTRGEVIQARARQRQAELALARARTSVSVEVTQALRTLREAYELLSAARRSVQQAEEGLRLAEARYQSGVATQLDVLDAQVALTEARTNVLQANYRNATAIARVRRAIGSADPFVLSATR